MSKIHINQIKGSSGGGGIDGYAHQELDTLVHNIDENSFDEIIRVDNKISSIIVWNDSGKTLKIRETQVLRAVSGKVNQIITVQYDGYGNPVETLTETIERLCGKVNSIIRTRTTS
jgi:hypothetical protein